MKYKKIIISALYFFSIFRLSFSEEMKLRTYEEIKIEEMNKQIENLKKEIKILEDKKGKEEKEEKIKVGVALSGGGAKGLAHIGVLRELENLGIKIDYISGTSMGSIVASLYSVGYSLDEIEEFIIKNDWNSVVTGKFVKNDYKLEKKINSKEYTLNAKYDNKFNIYFPKSLGDNEFLYLELKKIFSRVENIKDFDEFKIPLRVVATNLNTGEAKSFKSGDLAKVVIASSAIPTIFSPVNIDGEPYVDGLIARNLPVIDCYEMGADIVIASDVGNELKEQENYNIISILQQIVSIQSTKNTLNQQKLATVLISPDVDNFSITDLKKSKELIQKGRDATQKEIKTLEKIKEKVGKTFENRYEDTKNLREEIVIQKFKIVGDISEKDKRIILKTLNKIKNKKIKNRDLENIMLEIYGNDSVNKIYYTLDGDELVLTPEISPSNTFGIGLGYSTGKGTSIELGGTLSSIGKFGGNNTLLNLQLGDYLGVSLKNFTYYGYSNKIGLFANLNYLESPLYLYQKNSKLATLVNEKSSLELGILTQYRNNLVAEYGVSFLQNRLYQKIGSFSDENVEYKRYITGAFTGISYDSINSNLNPTSGIKGELKYSWEGSFDRSKSNVNSTLYSVMGYLPVGNKLTFLYGVDSGIVFGDKNTFFDNYIKLGGTKTNIKNKEFSFYGYHYQQKLVEKFVSLKLGFKYNFISDFYLITRWNIGTFEEYNNILREREEEFWNNYQKGIDIGINYQSIVGPIELSFSKNSKSSNIITQFSIGYFLD